MQTQRRFSLILGVAVFLLVFSSALLVWVLLPSQSVSHEILIEPFTFDSSGDSPQDYYYPVQNTLSFSWPEDIQLGGQDEVSLRINGEQSQQGLNYAEGSRNITEDHNIVFEARLDLTFSTIWPVEEIKKPVNSAKSTDFEWQINLDNKQEHSGKLWVYINFVPQNGGESIRKALSAVPVEIKTTSLFGISVKFLKWIISAGYLAAIMLTGLKFFGTHKTEK